MGSHICDERCTRMSSDAHRKYENLWERLMLLHGQKAMFDEEQERLRALEAQLEQWITTYARAIQALLMTADAGWHDAG